MGGAATETRKDSHLGKKARTACIHLYVYIYTQRFLKVEGKRKTFREFLIRESGQDQPA